MKLMLAILAGWVVLITCISQPSAGQIIGSSPSSIEPPPLAWRADAALRDVFFLNHDLGWAVGDQGTILRTEDGGRSWQLVPLNISCSLRSVRFVDEQNGWASGGQALPLVNRTHAVLLRTRDGGRTWQPTTGTLLPALRDMRMSNGNSGWAWGAATQHFSSGIFRTEDGGQSWSDFPQRTRDCWQAVCASQNGFAVATDLGQLGLYHEGQFRPSRQPTTQSTSWQLVFFDPSHGWAVGDRDLLITEDGGASWQEMGFPSGIGEPSRFEFTTAAEAGTKRWLAGSPGTYVFCHDEKTNQWSRARTPIRSAIHRLFFVDQDHGWAAGDGGHILVTRDGGLTWQSQRSAEDRVALLVICPTAQSIPLDLLARYSADQGYLTAVFISQAESIYGDGPQRALDACQRQGVSTFVYQPVSQGADLTSRFVGLIRQLQPSAIVIAEAFPKPIDPAASTAPVNLGGNSAPFELSWMVLSAMKNAANPNLDREWIGQVALPPWQTPFLFWTREKKSDHEWGSPEFLPSLGRNLFDQQLISRAIISPPSAPSIEVEMVAFGDRTSAAASNIFEGLGRGSFAPPRRPEQAPRGHAGQIKAVVNKGLTFHQLTSQFDSSPTSLPVWRQRVDQLSMDLAPEVAGIWLWQLSESYWQADQLELAAFARAMLLERFADHPLAWESRSWLAHYYLSAELSWREFQQQRRWDESRIARHDPAVRQAGLRSSPAKTVVDGVTQLVWEVEMPEDGQRSSDPRAEIQGLLPAPTAANFDSFFATRIAIARNLFRSIHERDPELMADPQMGFAECLLRRRTEGPLAAESSLRKLPAQQLSAAQRQNIAREIRLNSSKSWDQMRDVVDCPRATSVPYLDGQLDDDAWRDVAQSDQIIRLSPALELGSASFPTSPTEPGMRTAGDPNLGQTQLMLAHDDQYLYVAAICYCPEGDGSAQPAITAKRQRDQQLDPEDQLQFALDLDRDGRTRYLFSIDARGSFVDQIGADRQWNPTWHLAHARNELNWTIETAIPLDQLGPPPTDAADSAWGISIRRQRADGHNERWSPVQSSVDDSLLDGHMSQPDLLPPDGVIRFR